MNPESSEEKLEQKIEEETEPLEDTLEEIEEEVDTLGDDFDTWQTRQTNALESIANQLQENNQLLMQLLNQPSLLVSNPEPANPEPVTVTIEKNAEEDDRQKSSSTAKKPRRRKLVVGKRKL